MSFVTKISTLSFYTIIRCESEDEKERNGKEKSEVLKSLKCKQKRTEEIISVCYCTVWFFWAGPFLKSIRLFFF